MKNVQVYKFYNKDNQLLYVGITNNFRNRFYTHTNDKEWIEDVSYIKVSKPMTRNKAHIYEIYYVATENPKYNIDFAEGGDVDIELPDIEFDNVAIPEFKDGNVREKLSDEEIRVKINELDEHLGYLSENKVKLFREEQDELRKFFHKDIIGKFLRHDRQIGIRNINNILTGLSIIYVISSFKETFGNMKGKRFWIVEKIHNNIKT